MSRFVGAGEAARLLGIQKATLYAYVSRGLIERRVAVDGRTSLYAVDDVEALVGRARRREVEPRPSLDVQIVTGVTTLDESGVQLPRPRRRRAVPHRHLRAGGRAAVDGWSRPGADVAGAGARRPGDRGGDHGCRRRRRCPGASIAVASALSVRHPADDPATAARVLIGVAPAVVRRQPLARDPVDRRHRCPPRRGVASRSAARRSAARSTAPSCCWPTTSWPRRRSPCASPARRGRVRTSPTPPGWRRSPGPYHGGAARTVHQLLDEAEREGGGQRRHAPPAGPRAVARVRPQDLRRRRPAARSAARAGARSCPTRTAGWTSSRTCWSRPVSG